MPGTIFASIIITASPGSMGKRPSMSDTPAANTINTARPAIMRFARFERLEVRQAASTGRSCVVEVSGAWDASGVTC